MIFIRKRCFSFLQPWEWKKQAQIEQQQATLAKSYASLQSREQGLRDDAGRRQEQWGRIQQAHRACVDQCGELVAEAFARMGHERETKETAVAVLCRELMTANADMAQAINRLELQHHTLNEQLSAAQELEVECARALPKHVASQFVPPTFVCPTNHRGFEICWRAVARQQIFPREASNARQLREALGENREGCIQGPQLARDTTETWGF